jgi:hypothetical protein
VTFLASVITPAKKQQTLIKDKPGAIYIDIRGYPEPDFVWKKNATVLNITGRYSVASNGTLFISKVQTGDNGTYAATATKDFYTAESGNIVVKLLGEWYTLLILCSLEIYTDKLNNNY